jgi:hypothetical protein
MTTPSILVQRYQERLEKLRQGGVTGVEVGVRGVRYAAFHEYGTKPSAKMYRWLMANLFRQYDAERAKARPKDRPKMGRSKGVLDIQGEGDARTARIRPRPFVGPALGQKRDHIMTIMRETLGPQPISMEKAMVRIGMLLEAQMVLNVKQPPSPEAPARGPIVGRTGAILNAIRYELMTK